MALATDARGAGSGIGLAASMGSREDIDRGALARADQLDIDADAKVKIQVGGKTASEKTSSGELFKNGTMKPLEQMPHTSESSSGASVDEVAKQYMANRAA
jgi:hypothetical protein